MRRQAARGRYQRPDAPPPPLDPPPPRNESELDDDREPDEDDDEDEPPPVSFAQITASTHSTPKMPDSTSPTE